jgi:hypothetical protein
MKMDPPWIDGPDYPPDPIEKAREWVRHFVDDGLSEEAEKQWLAALDCLEAQKSVGQTSAEAWKKFEEAIDDRSD